MECELCGVTGDDLVQQSVCAAGEVEQYFVASISQVWCRACVDAESGS